MLRTNFRSEESSEDYCDEFLLGVLQERIAFGMHLVVCSALGEFWTEEIFCL